jgi:hypothetical protein
MQYLIPSEELTLHKHTVKFFHFLPDNLLDKFWNGIKDLDERRRKHKLLIDDNDDLSKDMDW